MTGAKASELADRSRLNRDAVLVFPEQPVSGEQQLNSQPALRFDRSVLAPTCGCALTYMTLKNLGDISECECI